MHSCPVPTTRRRTALLLAVFAAIATSLLAPTALAAGAPAEGDAAQVTFGIQPATATGASGAGFFDINATPGARLRQFVLVTNYSEQPIELTLHPTDATTTSSGGLALQPPNVAAHTFGTWLRLPPSAASVDLPPRGNVIVPFTVAVPATATPGDRVGGILATLRSSVASPNGQSIDLLQSVGTRIFLRISGPLHPRLAVEHLSVSYRGTLDPVGDGSAQVRFTVHNTGNVALGGRQTVSVTGLVGGRILARNLPTVQLLLPGSSVSETVTFPHSVYPQFHMHAHVSITPLVVPGSVQPPSGPYVAERAFWAVPWGPLAIVIALGSLLAGVVARRRRSAGGGAVEADPPPGGGRTPSPDDAPTGGPGAGEQLPADPLEAPRNPVSTAGRAATRRRALSLPAPVLAVAAVALTGATARAAAATVTPPDPGAVGYVGFCDRSGQQITSGNLTDEPFAWVSVSSTPAPAGYEKGKATLFAYQPRPQVPAEEWSGDQLTGSSTFSDPAHPVVQATAGDSPLLNAVQAYPPQVDGLVELRIYLSAVNAPPARRSYPATFVQVSGSRWQQLGGGKVDCAHAGTGVSDEVVELPAAAASSQQPVNTAGLAASPSAPTTGLPGATGGDHAPPAAAPGSAGASQASGGKLPGASAAPATRGSSAGHPLSAPAIAVLVLGAGVTTGLIGAMLRWYRRRT